MDRYFSDDLEIEYSRNSAIELRKKYGQFFTPFKIACFMSEWVLSNEKNSLSVLDPSAGFGVFARAIMHNNREMQKNLNFDLFEIDQYIASTLAEVISQLGIQGTIHNADFLKSSWRHNYDCIIANPPYYKHHYIVNKEDVWQDICLHAYYKFSIQTNIYCWFLIKCMNLLADRGRLAFIVPSEFLNANYGEKVKSYLLKTGNLRHLINIDFRENVFENALTTAVIILAEKSVDNLSSINIFNVQSVSDIVSLQEFINSYPRKTYEINELDSKAKWQVYFNGSNKGSRNNLVPLKHFGRFVRGIATGANRYFTLSKSEVAQYNLPEEVLIPCITKSNHAKNCLFSIDDYKNLASSGKKVYLFDGEKSSDQSVLDYLNKGESEGIDKRFLTRHRTPWFSLEKRKKSNIWVAVFGRNGLKFVWNDTECLNLTCFHAFYPSSEGEKFMRLFFLYLNTSLASKLFEQEKRQYGNGLEKYEPNDLNRSLIPDFRKIPADEIEELEFLQRMFLQVDDNEKIQILKKADTLFNKVLELGPEEHPHPEKHLLQQS